MSLQVFNELRNPRKRAEHDLLTFCHVGDLGPLKQLLGHLPEFPFVPVSVSPLPMTVVRAGSEPGSVREDFLSVPACPIAFSRSAHYEDLEQVLPPILFPS